jgi:osmotically-inducible protein OsmY
VLLGVVSGDEERRQAVDAVSGVEGVKGVTNWLLVPEPDYMAVRPKLR